MFAVVGHREVASYLSAEISTRLNRLHKGGEEVQRGSDKPEGGEGEGERASGQIGILTRNLPF